MLLTTKIKEHMSNEKRPKWEIGATISAGNNAYALAINYRNDLEPRLQPDELGQFKANITELDAHRSGQTENLVEQKSKTLGQDEQAAKLRSTVVSIRNIVKNNGVASPDILKAFGVGERITSAISSVVAGGNIIVSAYNSYTDWSNSAGIIEADITEITNLISQLVKAEEVQGNAMFTRKSKTMDKNVLQRAVEDEVSKISALGQHIFHSRDAAVAKLFEDLIPAAAKVKNGAVAETKATTQEKTNT